MLCSWFSCIDMHSIGSQKLQTPRPIAPGGAGVRNWLHIASLATASAVGQEVGLPAFAHLAIALLAILCFAAFTVRFVTQQLVATADEIAYWRAIRQTRRSRRARSQP